MEEQMEILLNPSIKLQMEDTLLQAVHSQMIVMLAETMVQEMVG